jgi:gamma-glutamyltranspeptidase
VTSHRPSLKIIHNRQEKLQVTKASKTTHYSIVDAQGNAISATTTLNDNYGSKIYCDEFF